MADERIPDPDNYESPPRLSLDYDALRIEDTPIGRGGQAVVYEATVTGSAPPRQVAIKQPLQPSTVTETVVDAFLSEAATWETVDARERKKLRWEESEYVVGVVDTGDQLPWIAMEYMDGGSLADRLEDEPDGLPIAEALWIGESVCRGLEVAHSYGIAHLDLKPANVLFRATDADSWNHPKIADWGLARVLAERTGSMDARSPRYSAPEQFEPESFGDPDTLTDIYQVGGLVYAMLTGSPPYQGPQFSVISDIISTDPPAPPSTHRPAISPALDDALTKALNPSKRDRYDSIQSLRKALVSQRTGESMGVGSVAATATDSENDNDTSGTASDSSTRPWPTFQSDPERTGYTTRVTGPQNAVEPAWVFSTDDAIRCAPAVGDGSVYVGSTDGTLYALDSENGTLEWQYDIGWAIRAAPTLDEDTVYLGSDDGCVYAFDIDKGSCQWTFETDQKVRSAPVIVGETLYVGSDDGQLYALKASTGEIEWTHEVRGTIRSAPAVKDETVYLGSGTGTVYALSKESGPVVTVGPSEDGTWATQTDNWIESSPAVDGRTVYVGSADRAVYALDAVSGEVTWQFETGDRIRSSPAVSDGRVYVASDDKTLYALDTDSGDRKWTYETRSGIRASPVLDSELLYTGARDGTVLALDPENGQRHWSFDIGGAVRTAPAVGNGVLYIGNAAGALYALCEQ